MNSIRTIGKHQILSLNVSVLVFQEEGYFIAFCPALKLSSYGDSIEDAKEGFEEVITAYIEETQRQGTLNEDLTKHGWVFHSKQVFPPEQVDIDNIPAGLLKRQFNQRYEIPVC
ncbi:MAG: type II toxin-antitoxin system HicB family antitoxin [Flavipsychrobacter sp.]|nr:type II toxin-antitoxin system HicB family antitoxin [Flavipsychrobacter sp.]